jgi:hypothetical protein
MCLTFDGVLRINVKTLYCKGKKAMDLFMLITLVMEQQTQRQQQRRYESISMHFHYLKCHYE